MAAAVCRHVQGNKAPTDGESPMWETIFWRMARKLGEPVGNNLGLRGDDKSYDDALGILVVIIILAAAVLGFAVYHMVSK